MSRYEQMMKRFYGPGISEAKITEATVPLEPTQAMIDAGIDAFQHCRYQESDHQADWKAFYRACIAAAPQIRHTTD